MTEQTQAEASTGAASATDGERKLEARPIQQPPEPDYDFLDAARLRLFWDGTGRLRATVEGDRSFLDVNVVRCFPQSIPDRFWALTDRSGRVIGVVTDPMNLDETSRTAAIAALARHYFLPVITAIRSLKEEFGAVYFEVETDRGPRAFVAKGVREGIQESEDGEVALADINESRYVIPDWRLLDAKSQKLLNRIL